MEAFTKCVEIMVAIETGYEVVDLRSTKTEERRKWNVAASVADLQSLSTRRYSRFFSFSQLKRVLLRVRECSSNERFADIFNRINYDFQLSLVDPYLSESDISHAIQ